VPILITRNFIKASFIYTIAGALPLASAVILLPFYIAYLPTDVYGALALYFAFSLFVQIVVTFSFDSSTYIHYHDFKNDLPRLATFLSSAFLFMLMIGAGVGFALVVLGDWVFNLIFDNPTISFYPFGLMSIIMGIFQAIFKVYSNILQSREKPVLFLRSNLLQFVLIAMLTVSGLYVFPETLFGPIGGRMIAAIVVACWSLYKVFNEFGFHFNYPLLKSTFGYNIYAFIHQVQQWGINYLDRFLMLFFLPLSTIGIYDFAIKCLIVLEFVLNGLHNSFYPKVVSVITAQTVKYSTPELNRYYYGLVAVIMVLVSLSIIILPFLLDLFETTQGYQDAVQYFPYIAVMYILKAMRQYFATPYGILKHTKPLPLISFVISLLKIGMIVLLINRFEIYGVIISAVLSAAIELLLLNYALKGKFRFQYNVFKMLAAPLALLFAVLVLEPIFADKYALQVHILYLMITGSFLLWVYRNELKLLNFSKIVS